MEKGKERDELFVNRDMFHIHLPDAGDDFASEFERVLGIKLIPVYPQMIPSEEVEVCPPTISDSTPGFMELKYKK